VTGKTDRRKYGSKNKADRKAWRSLSLLKLTAFCDLANEISGKGEYGATRISVSA
jgi:hypothetical protein